MNDFIKFAPIQANQERARRFWEIRNQNEKNGVGKTEIVTLKNVCGTTQVEKQKCITLLLYSSRLEVNSQWEK